MRRLYGQAVAEIGAALHQPGAEGAHEPGAVGALYPPLAAAAAGQGSGCARLRRRGGVRVLLHAGQAQPAVKRVHAALIVGPGRAHVAPVAVQPGPVYTLAAPEQQREEVGGEVEHLPVGDV